MIWQKDGFEISTDKRKLHIAVIHQYLAVESYWAHGIPLEKVRLSLKNSRCFGIYHEKKLVGFCRVVSDNVRFAWLGDVFVLPEFRGRGLSKWLMECVLEDYAPLKIRRWTLGTKDAHGLYRQFGFTELPEPGRVMVKSFDGDW